MCIKRNKKKTCQNNLTHWLKDYDSYCFLRWAPFYVPTLKIYINFNKKMSTTFWFLLYFSNLLLLFKDRSDITLIFLNFYSVFINLV